jgi:hypothetical protein
MSDITTLVARLGLMWAAPLLLTSCGPDTESSTAGVLCDASIEFRGHVVTATAANDSAKPGRELGQATIEPCGGGESYGDPQTVTVYAVVGTPASKAVIAEPLYGHMTVLKPEVD